MAHTYILYSKSLDSYYIGHTELDPAERLNAHLMNHTGFTNRAKDWILVFQQYFHTKAEANKFERQIKGWKSRRAIENLIKST